MISSSRSVKCLESRGTVVRFRGRFLRCDSGRRLFLGIAAARRASAIDAIFSWCCTMVTSCRDGKSVVAGLMLYF